MTARHAALLGALAALWGASYLFIKYALEDVQAPVIVFGRVALAAVVLGVILRIQGGEALDGFREPFRRPGLAILLAVVAIAAPFMLITLGELEVPSGLTSVLIAPAPLFVAMFAPALDRSETISRRQAIGLLIGLGGVAVLVGVESVGSTGEILGALAILAACACYGLSSFIVKGPYAGMSSIAVSFVSIATAAVLTLPAAIAYAPTEMPGTRALLSIAVLGVGGTALAFVIFYKLIAEMGAGRASLVSYLAPGFALIYGALLLDESITAAGIVGLLLILGGVTLASRRPAAVVQAEQAPVTERL